MKMNDLYNFYVNIIRPVISELTVWAPYSSSATRIIPIADVVTVAIRPSLVSGNISGHK